VAEFLTIDEHDRQARGSFPLHEIQDARVRDEWLRILGEVVASDRDALSGEPLHISGERRKQRIHARAAHTGRATHGRIEDFDMSHMSTLPTRPRVML
jgi:hypothetical protein